MFITIINDCNSQNDIGRQETRFASFFENCHISFVGVASTLGSIPTLEAAGNLVDCIDASNGTEGIIIVNVAPRGEVKEDGKNGSSFCYFWHKDTLIISTIKGYTLSLVQKLGVTNSVSVADVNKVINYVVKLKLIDKDAATRITKSQFRSFDFAPRLARWLTNGIQVPFKNLPLTTYNLSPDSIWLIDSFGNAKLTLLKTDLPLKGNPLKVKINLGTFSFYERLKDVPDGETAIYIGSSGIGDKRFLEIATQNRSGSAAKTLNLKVGKEIKILNL